MSLDLNEFDLADFVQKTLEVKDEIHKADVKIHECMLEDAKQEIDQLKKENQALKNRKKIHTISKTKEFEIKKGIPLPKHTRGKPRKYDLPLEELEVNDNIHIPIPKTQIAQEQKIIRNFVLRFSYKNPTKKLTVRQLEDGIGIWRIN